MVTKKYRALIERFPLVPIKSDAHLDKAHSVAQSLMLRKEPVASDEREYLEVLPDLKRYGTPYNLKEPCSSNLFKISE